MQEKELVKKLQAEKHKDNAFQLLVDLYKERLYWHIRHIVKIHEDADDVLQNTFIKIYKNIDRFKGESKLYSWMYRIATNESITFLNKKAKKQKLSSQELQEHIIENLASDVYFEGNEIQLQLQKAIASLPDKQQEVFNLKYFQEMKYAEMSELLGTSIGALKSSYHLVSKKIEKYLKSN